MLFSAPLAAYKHIVFGWIFTWAPDFWVFEPFISFFFNYYEYTVILEGDEWRIVII